MSLSSTPEKQRWVVHCDPLTVDAIKALAAGKRQSIGETLDQAVEYFSRKVRLSPDFPSKWSLPDDF
jgi:hypothetical protein